METGRYLRLRSPLAEVREFKRDPTGTQRRVLEELLHSASGTEWGRRLGFPDIIAAPDMVRKYQEQVPLHDYSAYEHDVERVRAGESDVFWPGKFKHFAVSSGTASSGNLIPLSARMLMADRRFGLAAALTYMRIRGIGTAFGRLLSIPGRVEEVPDRSGVYVGEVSGLLALFSPWIVRRFYEAVSHDILFMPHWDRKLDAIVDATLEMDIRAIAMVPSWAIVLFRKLIERHNVRHQRKVNTVREIWPNLKVFFSGGVALASYRDLLDVQIGGDLDYIESYGASEGFISFQEHPNHRDMLVHLDSGVFFEFVRMDDTSESPRRFTIADIETGVRYRLYVSTCSGLWGYGIGDVIRFTSTSPHRIEVVGRTNEMIDVYGEAVYGDEAREGLITACRRMNASVRDYHIAPIPATSDRLPGHQWLIEFETPPDDLHLFSAIIDRHLQTVNRHYVIRREAEAFTPPEIVALREGTFLEWMHRNHRQISAQSKVPRMRDDRRIADEVLRISGNNP